MLHIYIMHNAPAIQYEIEHTNYKPTNAYIYIYICDHKHMVQCNNVCTMCYRAITKKRRYMECSKNNVYYSCEAPVRRCGVENKAY